VFTNLIPASAPFDPTYELLPEYLRLNAFAILDDFQDVKTPLDALDFLNKTGPLSLMDSQITWSYFQKWQRFAYLVQEHESLATTMRTGDSNEEHLRVLSALAGDDQEAFFEGSAVPPLPQTKVNLAQWMKDKNFVESIENSKRIIAEDRSKVCMWFRAPPDEACQVRWIPKNEDNCKEFEPLLDQGALIEFLLPQEAMRPILTISPSFTLEAIAAAIFADRIDGVEYRACEVCSDLFKVGTRREKKYCSRERCKNTAHQRRMRANRANAKIREKELTKKEA
jgi:hypothetical protein